MEYPLCEVHRIGTIKIHIWLENSGLDRQDLGKYHRRNHPARGVEGVHLTALLVPSRCIGANVLLLTIVVIFIN